MPCRTRPWTQLTSAPSPPRSVWRRVGSPCSPSCRARRCPPSAGIGRGRRAPIRSGCWTGGRIVGAMSRSLCGPSGLVVLDLDVAKRPDDEVRHGADCLRQVAAGRRVPMTSHGPYAERRPASLLPGAARPADQQHRGQDRPADRHARSGGYVVAPGSIIRDGGTGRCVTCRSPSFPAGSPTCWPTGRGATRGSAVRRRDFGDISPAYAAAALRNELDRVLRARPGTRNDTLNRAAFALGRLVGAGALDQATAVDELHDAGERPGCPCARSDPLWSQGSEPGWVRGRRYGRTVAGTTRTEPGRTVRPRALLLDRGVAETPPTSLPTPGHVIDWDESRLTLRAPPQAAIVCAC